MSVVSETVSVSMTKSPAPLLGSVVVTLFLFSLMALMIENAAMDVETEKTRKLADIVMPDREIDTRYKQQKPEKPDAAEAAPDLPPMEFEPSDAIDDSMSVKVPSIRAHAGLSMGGIGGEGDYLPIVKVQPIYPRRALQRGTTGYVLVEFTVTENGSVKDVQVIEEDPPGVFTRAAVNAAAKFKYKPRIVDGQPVEVLGVQNKIVFMLEE